MQNTLLASFVAAGLCLGNVGCERKKPAPPTVDAVEQKAAPAAPSATPTAVADGGAPSAGVLGVVECDDYLKKMDACLAKMPPANKAAMEQGVKASRDAWKAAAATPQGKEGLKTACKAAADAMAQNPACK